jgi:hypothetical protein
MSRCGLLLSEDLLDLADLLLNAALVGLVDPLRLKVGAPDELARLLLDFAAHDL